MNMWSIEGAEGFRNRISFNLSSTTLKWNKMDELPGRRKEKEQEEETCARE